MKMYHRQVKFMLCGVSAVFLACFVSAGIGAEHTQANPKQPVYGARSPAGDLQFNPEWVEPLRSLLKGVDSIDVTDEQGKRRFGQALPVAVKGEQAQQLVGAIAVIVNDGEIFTKPDDERTIVLKTDRQSVEIAEFVLPDVLRRLELGQKEGKRDEESQFIANLQGRWTLESVASDIANHDNAHPLLHTLTSRSVASFSGEMLYLSDSTVPTEGREGCAIKVNVAADPVQIDFDLEDDELMRGLLWMSGDEMLLVFSDGRRRPDSLKAAPGQLRMSYKRDESDPVFLRNYIDQLRDLGISHLMYDSVAGFRNARPFLEWSMLLQREAELRERSEELAVVAAEHEAAGRVAEAKKALADSESRSLLADEAHAEYLEVTRRQSEMRRLQDRAKQLVQRIVYMQSARQHAEAQELQSQLDQLLQENDTDNWRIYDLQGRATVARLEGKHELAERLQSEADELRAQLRERYPAASVEEEKRPAKVLTIKLKHIRDASEIEAVLTKLGMLDEHIGVAAVESGRAVVLRGDAERVEDAVHVIGELDVIVPEADLLVPARSQSQAGTAVADKLTQATYVQSLRELESLQKQLGTQHPDVQDSTATLNARYAFFGVGQWKHEVTDWTGVISRQEERLREAEQAMLVATTAYRKSAFDGKADQQQGRRDVQSAVRSAFEHRMVLQVMQLQKAHHDLDGASQRLRQRKQLEQRIIDRQVERLTKPPTVEATGTDPQFNEVIR